MDWHLACLSVRACREFSGAREADARRRLRQIFNFERPRIGRTLTKNRIVAAVLLGGLPMVSGAVTVSLHPSNVGIGSIAVNVSGTTITVDEDWTTVGPGFLEISDLDFGVNYTIIKNITNNTGVDWTSLANEILDPDNGLGSNDDLDAKPYPSYVPSTFTTSNDFDGISFAQGSGLPRTSNVFPNLTVDELATVDFLDFFGGILVNGGTDIMTYGLRDNGSLSEPNQPFLLSQRPNEFTVPEPSTLLLAGAALIGAGAARKRAKSSR